MLARRLGLAGDGRHDDPGAIGRRAVFLQLDFDVGRARELARLHAEDARGERARGDAEGVRRHALGERRERAHLLAPAAWFFGMRHDRGGAVRLGDRALQPQAGLRQRVDEDVAEQVRKRLVEPALGDDVLVELLAERIPLVDLAPGELRVDARERAADESRLLLLESL